MSIFTITIGDWSGDGHGKCEKFHVVVPDHFTKEILFENYNKNKKDFGFGLSDFAEEYEDSAIPLAKLNTLLQAGFDEESLKSFIEEEYGKYPLCADEMLEIAMFFFSHGLDNFRWEILKTDGDLIGFRENRAESGFVGYGIF